MPTVPHKEMACEEDISRDFMGLSDQAAREIDMALLTLGAFNVHQVAPA